MSDIQMANGTAEPPADDPWAEQFARLRQRFPKAKDTILFCVHALQQGGDDVDPEDLKAQALMHGLRITAASVNAARRLLNPEAHPPRPRRRAVQPPPEAPATRAAAGHPAARGRPRDRVGDGDAIEHLAREFAARVRTVAGDSRLRDAVREALAIAAEALEDE